MSEKDMLSRIDQLFAELKPSMSSATDLMAPGDYTSPSSSYKVGDRPSMRERESIAQSICPECKNPPPHPLTIQQSIWLHAWRYEGPDWQFETNRPAWSMEGYDDRPVLDAFHPTLEYCYGSV
jgi:hypothetical protein